jgi:hypothetical protein
MILQQRFVPFLVRAEELVGIQRSSAVDHDIHTITKSCNKAISHHLPVDTAKQNRCRISKCVTTHDIKGLQAQLGILFQWILFLAIYPV